MRTLGALRDLMAANDITPADVRVWAAAVGLECHPRGTPSRDLIEDCLLARAADKRGA